MGDETASREHERDGRHARLDERTAIAAPSINRTAWLLQAEPSTLITEDRRFLDRLRVEAPDLAKRMARPVRKWLWIRWSEQSA